MDDFTSYGTDAGRVARLLNGSYAQEAWTELVADPDPSAGGVFCLKVNSNADSNLRRVLTAPQTTIGVAARYWLTALPSSTTSLPLFTIIADSNNAGHIFVTCDPSGYFQAYRQDNAGNVLIGTSSSPQVIANAWRHVEIKVVLNSATSGSVEVRVEGTTVLNVTGIRTTSDIGGRILSGQNVILSNVRGAAPGPTMYVKDYIIWDGSGASNNNFLGSCQVYKIIPDGDVVLPWTPSSGSTGFNLINETTPSEDTGYISASSALPAASEFTMTNLPVDVTSVKGVMAINRSRKTDGGDANLQVSLISGANTGNGSNRTITTAYTYWTDMFDTDPSGGAWSKALVDAVKMKINRTV